MGASLLVLAKSIYYFIKKGNFLKPQKNKTT